MVYSYVRTDFSVICLNQGVTKGSETKPKQSQDIKGHFEVKLSIASTQNNRIIFTLLGQRVSDKRPTSYPSPLKIYYRQTTKTILF